LAGFVAGGALITAPPAAVLFNVGRGPAPNPIEIECGRSFDGTSGVITIHLPDVNRLAPGALRLRVGTLQEEGAKPGTIDLAVMAGGHPAECESTAPNQFQVRSTAAWLVRRTLRILAQTPVSIQVVDAHGQHIASKQVDPTHPGPTTISW